jgi:hypothetical protein
MALGPKGRDQLSPHELHAIKTCEAYIDQELRMSDLQGEITIDIDTDFHHLTETGAKALEERYKAAGWSEVSVRLHHEQIVLRA